MKLPRRALFPLAVWLLAGLPAAQAPSTVETRARFAELDAWLHELVDERRVVSAAAQVGVAERVLFREAHGLFQRGTDRALTPDALFRIYSMSKPITSVAAMMLVEEGVLALDDPIAKYLPAFQQMEVVTFPPGRPQSLVDMDVEPAARPITVRMLLNHTSGLIYGIFDRGALATIYEQAAIWEPGLDLDEFVERVASLPLAFQPGEEYRYSVSTDVLGAVIEEAAGAPFPDVLRERIFEPLGMVDTGFFVPAEEESRFVHLYYRQGGEVVTEDVEGRLAFLSPDALPSGGGGLVSTLDDYARFCRMLAGEGALDDVRLLSEETFRSMTAAPADSEPAGAAFPPGVGFALGFRVVRDGALLGAPERTGQLSWGGAANTEFLVVPERDLYAIFMTQVMPYSPSFQPAFAQRVHAAFEAR